MSAFSAGGVRLHYAVHGEGDPVVLLHGFTSSGSSWKTIGWVDALVEAGFSAIALDARSHGESEPVFDHHDVLLDEEVRRKGIDFLAGSSA